MKKQFAAAAMISALLLSACNAEEEDPVGPEQSPEASETPDAQQRLDDAAEEAQREAEEEEDQAEKEAEEAAAEEEAQREAEEAEAAAAEEEEEEEEEPHVLAFSELDDQVVSMLKEGSSNEPGWSGSTEAYYEIVLTNDRLTDKHGNLDEDVFAGHVQWAVAENQRQIAAAEAAEQARQQQQAQNQSAPSAPTQQQNTPPSNTGGSGSSNSGGSSSGGSGGSSQAAPAAPSGRAAAESTAASVCGASVTWENLGPGYLGLYDWGSSGFRITTREGVTSSRLQFVAAHECGHILQHRAFGGSRQAARDSLNAIYGTSGDMGLEHNADCIAFALGYSDTPAGYSPNCSGAGGSAATTVINGGRP